MKKRPRSVTLVIQRDGATKTRNIRIPLWAFRVGIWTVGITCLLLVVVIALYGPLIRAAARVPGMERELARLKSENARVRELSAALDSAESRYSQVRQMMGGEIVRDPVVSASGLPIAPPIRARLASSSVDLVGGLTTPGRWPLDETGYLTRGQVKAGGHPEEYQTMYGHLSRILVTQGGTVASGEVIGLSGNTGRSTAPHLHFEIRRNGSSLDPLTMVKEGR